jgi:hypothetical protein
MSEAEFAITAQEVYDHVMAGIRAERERVLDILEKESADLIAKGDKEGDGLYILSKIIDEVEKQP